MTFDTETKRFIAEHDKKCMLCGGGPGSVCQADRQYHKWNHTKHELKERAERYASLAFRQQDRAELDWLLREMVAQGKSPKWMAEALHMRVKVLKKFLETL